MTPKEPVKLTREQGEYFLARHQIENLKALVLKHIKQARGRLRWDKGDDDDEYFAEEIARGIYNNWNDKKKITDPVLCNYCENKSIALVKVEGNMVNVCRKHEKEWKKQRMEQCMVNIPDEVVAIRPTRLVNPNICKEYTAIKMPIGRIKMYLNRLKLFGEMPDSKGNCGIDFLNQNGDTLSDVSINNLQLNYLIRQLKLKWENK